MRRDHGASFTEAGERGDAADRTPTSTAGAKAEEGEVLMTRRPQLRDAKGQFCKAKPPPLDPALLKRLGTIVVNCVTYDNVLEELRLPREPIREEDLR
jgi:hypothetical protein